MAIFEPDGTVHHLGLKKGDVGRYVLLPGDPGRVEVIARRFDNPRFVAQKREYTTWVGELDGVPVACTSTGIGCPSTAIAAEELHAIGADTFIRVGTSGGMQPGMQTGDLAVISGAIRDEGTSSHYLPRVGVAQSKDSFYGEVEPERMPISEDLARRWKAWIGGGAISSEMESATLFIVAATLRARAGGIMVCVGSPSMTHEESQASMKNFSIDSVIDTAVHGLRLLIARDRAAGA
ncbi:uridine phosphorylase [bacterium]|nr:uridine phosphorylase [bacterium]